MFRQWTFFGGLLFASALIVPAIGQDQTSDVKTDKSAAGKSVGEKSESDPYVVPDGDPLELMAYIKRTIRNLSEDEATYKKARAAMLKAAEKILAQKPSVEYLDFAVDVKMRSLDSPESIKAFADELKKEGHDTQSRTVHCYSMETNLRNAILSGKVDVQRKQMAAIIDFFKDEEPKASDLRLAVMVGQVAEIQGDNAYAVETYRKLQKIFSNSKDEKLAQYGKRAEGVVRRLSLLGKKMQLEGKLLPGEDFDFSKYQGKVVLVNFWASWRQACENDISKLKKAYELYHDKGFEIVGFSGDYRREDAEKFVKDNEITWATVYGDKGPSPTIEYYGILNIPTMILIDKSGKVADLNVNIDDLNKHLEKMLDPAKEKK